ncbi:hypothetical protein [uncultured Bacteroides sp.]|uniref:hypothetical protein n=1 Tax=uncultured Bacteroides sp. TaxID=162156 RepID=UPI002AAB8369|nr:hypothetical protein [uncultured Bacteroides sp.]
MSKSIKLINPKGEVKEFTNVEFFGFKNQVVETNSFISWANANNVCGTYMHNNERRLNTSVVDKFLEMKGYKWETE